ncbi:hypothetical protein [Sinorhizobium fredii]|uniref:hypothetical protein n=1 Tax=Rhizobium fredii TaxID=380 RepID=UPI0035167102
MTPFRDAAGIEVIRPWDGQPARSRAEADTIEAIEGWLSTAEAEAIAHWLADCLDEGNVAAVIARLGEDESCPGPSQKTGDFNTLRKKVIFSRAVPDDFDGGKSCACVTFEREDWR